MSAATMERLGVVNRVVYDPSLPGIATAYAEKVALDPTRAHAAHKALLRAWATGGVTGDDDAMSDIAMPVFEPRTFAPV